MKIFNYLIKNPEKLLISTFQHLYIVILALIFAIIVGLILGIFVTRERFIKFGKVIIAITGMLQSIPSVAIIALIFIYTGIGVKTAVISLFLYSIVPILFNTSSSLLSVPMSVKEAAKGMGMTNFEILLKVEIPLSIESIMAGIRTATTINISTATVATVIGAGGLGDIILIGLRVVKTDMIFAGALIVSLLAILFDILLSYIQKILVPKGLRLKKEEKWKKY